MIPGSRPVIVHGILNVAIPLVEIKKCGEIELQRRYNFQIYQEVQPVQMVVYSKLSNGGCPKNSDIFIYDKY